MNRISGVYKITNIVTGDFYIGSSKNVKKRWTSHKCLSTWKRYTNSPLYQDMQKYCVDKFKFEIIEETTELKQREQYWMNLLKPTYNSNNAKGWDIERYNRASKEYQQSEKGRDAKKRYLQSEKGKEVKKKYQQSEKGKKTSKGYFHQLCFYNGKTLTLGALSGCFQRAGIPHPTLEAKKYLCKND